MNSPRTSRGRLSIGVVLFVLLAVPAWAEEMASPCQGSLDALALAYKEDPATRTPVI